MTAIVGVLIGAIAGLGVFVIVRSFIRDRTLALTDLGAIKATHGIPASMRDERTVQAGRTSRRRGGRSGYRGLAGRAGVRVLDAVGFADVGVLNDQLRVLDRTVEQHAYEKLLGAVGGFTLPILTGAILAVGGVGVSPVFVLLVSILGTVGGFFYPDLPLNERVEERRRAFRHALGSYLDLVTILMAGGAGTESALEGAAEDGQGWPFEEIRNALRRASLTRTSPWEAFEELGIELGIPELQELAASVALAGSQGARIKQSLVAKADAMRAVQAAQLEEASERQTEKMLVPLIVMALGVTLFIGYGAVESITSGSEPEADMTQTNDPLSAN